LTGEKRNGRFEQTFIDHWEVATVPISTIVHFASKTLHMYPPSL
jgi:hypothetical protein